MFYLFINIVKEWQIFLGALVGYPIPITFWFFAEWYQSLRKRKKNLNYLEKILVNNINKVIDTRKTIKDFIDIRLTKLIENIDYHNKQNIYSVDTTFFPLFSVDPIEENLLRLDIESSYLINKIAQIHSMSNDFALMIDDMREQFRETIQMNKEMAFNKLNSPNFQNTAFKANIEEFRKAVKRDFFEKNIKFYIQILVSARVATSIIRDIGIIRWRSKFSPRFKYFKSSHDLKKFHNETFERIDKYLDDKINLQVQDIETKSQLKY